MAILGGVAAFGFVFLAIGAGILISQARFRRRAQLVTGTIVAMHAYPSPGYSTGGPVYRPTVRFTTAAGQLVEAQTRSGSNPPPGRVGQTVNVRYDPADPLRISTHQLARNAGCVAVAFALAGGFIVVIAVTVLIAVATH